MAIHAIMCRLVLMLTVLTHLHSRPPCPGSDICYCSSKNKTTSVFCYGNNIRRTIYFERLPDDVNKLHLEGFLFTNLSSDTFPPSLNIKMVHFKENEIVYIHPDLFENWGDLEELSFSDNKVQNTTEFFIAIAVVLKQGTNNIQIALQGMRVWQLQDPEFISGNLSKIIALNFSRNEFTSLNFTRLHIFSKLELLKVSENFIRKFDNFTVLPAIRYLDLSGNRLDNPVLCPDDKNYFPNLTDLKLSGNFIRIFNSTWLYCLNKMRKLDLSYNNIQFFNVSDIEMLGSLTDLNMQGNWLTIQNFWTDPFGRYPSNLLTIDLSQNEFVPFPPSMCPNASRENFTSVTHLDLSYNHIINLKNNHLYCFPNLVELRLSKNAISIISSGVFAPFGNLQHLYIDSQLRGIQVFEPSALNLTRLRKLDIKGNFLNFDRNDTRQLFYCCPSLKVLTISDNYIGSMNETMLAHILEPLTYLQRLLMKRFGLRNFPFDVVKKLKYLRELNIEKNAITSLHATSDYNFTTKIKYIFASSNKITFTSKDILPSTIMKSLKRLDVSNNLFDCGCNNVSRWFRDQINASGGVQNVQLVNWPSKYVCSTPPDMHLRLLKDYHMTEKDCTPPNPLLPGYIATGCSSFVIIVLVVVAFWNRWYLQYYWYRIKRRLKSKGSARDPERQPLARQRRPTFLYDAYVINSDADDYFVDHRFLPFVQDKLGYNVHTSNKNGAIGGSKADNYFDAMDVSKSVIVVFSKSLMKDAWCSFQVDIALMSRIASKGKKKIFVVIMNDTDMELAKKSWCVLLTKKTSARWSDIENSIRQRLLVEELTSILGSPTNLASLQKPDYSSTGLSSRDSELSFDEVE